MLHDPQKLHRYELRRASKSRDHDIGELIRTQRVARGVSQEVLGQSIGVTAQQIQKYENGTNRVAAGRLHRLAEVLDVPIAAFFSGDEHATSDKTLSIDDLKTEGATRLLQCYVKIGNSDARKALVAIATWLAEVMP